MAYITEPERKTPIFAETEVLVCGGGIAGVAAAVCAARTGASVLLVERYPYLGGLVTGGLVITTPPLDNGINLELAERLQRQQTYRESPNVGEDSSGSHSIGMVALSMAMDAETVKYELQQMLLEQKVKLLLHSWLAGLSMEGNAITGVVFESKDGRKAIKAGVVVDATGDGDICAWCGAPYETGESPLPITMMFNAADVDTKRALKRLGNWGNLRTLLDEHINKGTLQFDLGVYPRDNAPGVFAADLCYPGELNMWSGSLYGISGLDPDALSHAEVVTRQHVMALMHFLRANLEGFEKARIEVTATQTGVRETRRVLGDACPSFEEVKKTRFPDTVVKPYRRSEMRVPYRSLVPRNVDNLLVAGRCISARQDAMVQLRLIPGCLASGQAAGTAAGLALREGVTPGKLDVTLVQRALEDQGVDLGLPRK
jgi:hypothetical protein